MAYRVKQRIPVLAVLLALTVCGLVHGADINLSGIVIASACTIDTATQSQKVTFDQARATDYQTPGASGEWQDFSLTLSSCPTSTSSVTATFSGDPDSDDPTKFANTQGDAAGMALQIMSRDHLTEIRPAGTFTVNVDGASHRAEFPLSARMYAPTGEVTAGSFYTVVQFTFTYQ
ncbi:type 1 fimbrial protein [Salmonella enterica]|nr:type 1 fimbrial protein [Salmonella enterica]ELL0182369.1 type 1 fimbrial protein [Salmonella enterica]